MKCFSLTKFFINFLLTKNILILLNIYHSIKLLTNNFIYTNIPLSAAFSFNIPLFKQQLTNFNQKSLKFNLINPFITT